MDDEIIYDAIIQLHTSVIKQTEVQEQLLATLKGLIGALEENSQTNADLREAINKK